MIKNLLNILVILLMLSSFCFARSNDAGLQKEYGPDLAKAPFFLRFKFKNDYHTDWGSSTYAERKNFLLKYKKDLIAEQRQAKAKAKALAQKEKDYQRAKREEQRKDKERSKQQEREAKEEKKAYEQRQKDFSKAVREERRELEQAREDELHSGGH